MPPRVRQFVIDTALDVIAESFEAEAVVVVRREDGSAPAAVSTRFPPSWDDGSAARFELFGQLWNMLDEDPPSQTGDVKKGETTNSDCGDSGDSDAGANRNSANGNSANGFGSNGASDFEGWDPSVWSRTLGLGDHRMWLACRQLEGRRLAAAVIRSRPFDEDEQFCLRRLIASVSSAVNASPGSDVSVGSVSLIVEGTTTRAEVTVRAAAAGSVAFGEAATAEQAVAEAAVTLLGTPVTVAFAGRTDLDGVVVSIVVLLDGRGAPLIGLSTSESEPLSGVVEAVFSAAPR